MNGPRANQTTRQSLEDINRALYGAYSDGKLSGIATSGGGALYVGSMFSVPGPQPAEGKVSLLIKINEVLAGAASSTAILTT